MATERDVNLRLGTSLKPGGDSAFKNLAGGAKEFGKASDTALKDANTGIDKLLASASKLGDRLKEIGSAGVKSLSQIASAAQQVERSFGAIAVKTGMSYGQLSERNLRLTPHEPSAFRQAASTIGGHVGSFGGQLAGMAGFGGLLNPATAALSAFTLAVKAATMANELHYKSLERNPETGRQEENEVTRERARREMLREKGIHNLWGALSYGEEGYRNAGRGNAADWAAHPGRAREKYEEYIREGPGEKSGAHNFMRAITPQSVLDRQAKERRNALTFTQFQELYGQSGQEFEGKKFLAKMEIGLAGQKAGAEGHMISGIFGQRSDMTRLQAEADATLRMRRAGYGIQAGAAGERFRVSGMIRGEAGYTRESQFEDINRQIGMKESLLRVGAEGASRQSIIQAQLGEAERQQGVHGRRYQSASGEEQKALADVERAKEEKKGYAEMNRLADVAAAAGERRKAAEEAMIQAQQKSIDLRKAGEQNVLQIQQQQHDIMKGNLDTLNAQIQAEVRRKQGLKENLGLLHPAKLRTAVGIQRKIRMGRQVTQAEIGFMQSMPGDIFKGDLQQIGNQRANAGMTGQMISELMQGSHQDKRQKELEGQKISLRQTIDARIVIDEASLSDQLVEKIGKPVHQAIADMRTQLVNTMGQLENRRRANERASGSGF